MAVKLAVYTNDLRGGVTIGDWEFVVLPSVRIHISVVSVCVRVYTNFKPNAPIICDESLGGEPDSRAAENYFR